MGLPLSLKYKLRQLGRTGLAVHVCSRLALISFYVSNILPTNNRLAAVSTCSC